VETSSPHVTSFSWTTGLLIPFLDLQLFENMKPAVSEITFIVRDAFLQGHGTIGLELLEDVPDVDTVICSFGGGGLGIGIASALAALKPAAQVYACEVEQAAPLKASREAGRPVVLENWRTSYVEAMEGDTMLPETWKMASNLLHGPVVLTLEQIRQAIQLLVERSRVVSEGAGAVSVAAALTDEIPDGNIVCVISGGNIDSHRLVQVLQGNIPH